MNSAMPAAVYESTEPRTSAIMKAIALLGRKDSPTDGVADYCDALGEALAQQGVTLQQKRVPWAERGWWQGFRWLSAESRQWNGEYVLFQYTALGWSRRGFPLGALAVVALLRWRKVRCAAVFHDSGAWPGNRPVDRVRAPFQMWVIRTIFALSARSVFTLPLERISWLPAKKDKAAFIPLGANIPAGSEVQRDGRDPAHRPKTVAVFGVTVGRATPEEVADIAYALSQAGPQLSPLRLLVLGRGSDEAHEALEAALRGTGVQLIVRGVLPAAEIRQALCEADALLFVRGVISPRRSSAIAGVACGLPIVGYGEPESSFPISEAGVEFAPWQDRDALAKALCRVLSDGERWNHLHECSLRAQSNYFSWESIARQYQAVLFDG
jgi:glycosyltransferase involved in cell wall biosynthesis